MAEEPPQDLNVQVAVVQAQLKDVRDNMATKADMSYNKDNLVRFEAALSAEKAARESADAAEATRREADDKAEALARAAGDKANADRLQLVEDRQEARKYGVLIAIAVAVIGAFVSPIIGAVVMK